MTPLSSTIKTLTVQVEDNDGRQPLLETNERRKGFIVTNLTSGIIRIGFTRSTVTLQSFTYMIPPQGTVEYLPSGDYIYVGQVNFLADTPSNNEKITVTEFYTNS